MNVNCLLRYSFQIVIKRQFQRELQLRRCAILQVNNPIKTMLCRHKVQQVEVSTVPQECSDASPLKFSHQVYKIMSYCKRGVAYLATCGGGQDVARPQSPSFYRSWLGVVGAGRCWALAPCHSWLGVRRLSAKAHHLNTCRRRHERAHFPTR